MELNLQKTSVESFMKVEIVKKVRHRIPRAFILSWIKSIKKELVLRGESEVNKDLTVVFVSEKEIKTLNRKYRNKNKTTDILSFDPLEKNSLGELVLCMDVLKKKFYSYSIQYGIGYMILHGILHLLGYSHEDNSSESQKMFKIQDDVFFKLCKDRGWPLP